MTLEHYWPWMALFALGAYHGINPGMGWLFAVALGLQERNGRAVARALPPIALGNLVSIGLVVFLVEVAQLKLSTSLLRVATAIYLFGLGFWRLFRSRHPRWAQWVGMRVSFRNLTLWSFLMASAHGAGLMPIPIILGLSGGGHAHHMQMLSPSVTSAGLAGLS